MCALCSETKFVCNIVDCVELKKNVQVLVIIKILLVCIYWIWQLQNVKGLIKKKVKRLKKKSTNLHLKSKFTGEECKKFEFSTLKSWVVVFCYNWNESWGKKIKNNLIFFVPDSIIILLLKKSLPRCLLQHF